ncbi:DUF309 domain-containing protein [Metabacillus sp. 84]|uniref:DUF309 domain-containing protein n=1 Tax=unclassified Metabacillus TaxID=2675274 RepID=UPI003CF85A64
MEGYPDEYYLFFIHFNEGDFYTCHDLLEEIWLTDKSNLFLKGLLQMSVALYHYSYGNLKGARSMMLAGKQYIQPYRPEYWGINLDLVHQFMENCLLIIPQAPEKIPYEMTKSLPEIPLFTLYLE